MLIYWNLSHFELRFVNDFHHDAFKRTEHGEWTMRSM